MKGELCSMEMSALNTQARMALLNSIPYNNSVPSAGEDRTAAFTTTVTTMIVVVVTVTVTVTTTHGCDVVA